jgi:D-tyrosyl-tRNA(Tyr) deacylase
MRAVVQRVSEASVCIDHQVHASISKGLLILLGVEGRDAEADVDWLAGKVARLRVFPDGAGVMNRSVVDVQGDLLVVSQFTLFASTKKGNRPSYDAAAPPDLARKVYEQFVGRLRDVAGCDVKTGLFGANMAVTLVNDGPVTILMDTHRRE